MKVYMIYCVSARITYFWENLILDIWIKMFSANQTEGVLKRLYLNNKLIKQPDFLRADTIFF